MRIIFICLLFFSIAAGSISMADTTTNTTEGDGSHIINTESGDVSINNYYERTGSFNDPLFQKYDLSSPKEFLMLIYDVGLYERDDIWKHMITQEQIFKGKKKYGKDYIKLHYEVWTKRVMLMINEKYNGDIDTADIKNIKRGGNRARVAIKNKKKDVKFSMAIRIYNNRIFIAEN